MLRAQHSSSTTMVNERECSVASAETASSVVVVRQKGPRAPSVQGVQSFIPECSELATDARGVPGGDLGCPGRGPMVGGPGLEVGSLLTGAMVQGRSWGNSSRPRAAAWLKRPGEGLFS